MVLCFNKEDTSCQEGSNQAKTSRVFIHRFQSLFEPPLSSVYPRVMFLNRQCQTLYVFAFVLLCIVPPISLFLPDDDGY